MRQSLVLSDQCFDNPGWWRPFKAASSRDAVILEPAAEGKEPCRKKRGKLVHAPRECYLLDVHGPLPQSKMGYIVHDEAPSPGHHLAWLENRKRKPRYAE
jgi:hypothetical protein